MKSYDYRRASSTSEWVEEEVLTKEVRAALDEFARLLVREGQQTHKVVEKQLLWARENVEGGELVQSKDVVAVVLRHLARTLGDDALAKVIATALGTGDYLY